MSQQFLAPIPNLTGGKSVHVTVAKHNGRDAPAMAMQDT